ncbi:MAG: hypothetical protein KatS3mg008_0778 [Acidimicrobiales bacterium]|nr:MAG: hypothetical protein KatS3mg008_0778 [Acidimicrobiales bacterium]
MSITAGSSALPRTATAGFWLANVSVSAATFATVVVLARVLPVGELARVSAVVSLSFVMATVPGALQTRAAALRASDGVVVAPDPARVRQLALLSLAAGAAASWLLDLPLLVASVCAAQVVPAVLVSARRGVLIGSGDLGPVTKNHVLEALSRSCGGILGGALWGPEGVALALFFTWWVAELHIRRHSPQPEVYVHPLGHLRSLASVGFTTLAVHSDVLLASRLSDPADADVYAAAALISKGVFIALFAAGWLAIPAAAGAVEKRALLGRVAATVGIGASLVVAVTVGAPALAFVTGRQIPQWSLVLPTALAMAVAGGSWVGSQLLSSRDDDAAWWSPLTATVVLSVGWTITQPGPEGLAVLTLIAHLVACAMSCRRLASPHGSPTRRAGLARAGRDGSAVFGTPVRSGKNTGKDPGRLATATPARSDRVEKPTAPPRTAISHPGVSRPGIWWRLDRRGLVPTSVLVSVVIFAQQPGRTVADTKLDLALDPAAFLAKALYLWEPLAHFGHVQNQAVGYLFPMGPFFLFGRLLGVAPWILQRAWMAALVVAGIAGIVLLAERLQVGTRFSRLLGGVVYALSPLFVARMGSTSAFVLGAVAAPWALLPLVHTRAAERPGRSAARSAVAVLFAGGVNAVVTLAAVVPCLVWLATRPRDRRRLRLSIAWMIAVGAACFWWMAPLALQGRFGFDFIPYTESATTTTSYTPLVDVVRGTADWLFSLHLSEPWNPAGWTYASNPATVVATVTVACFGLAGLLRPDMPHRRFVATTFLLGVAILVSGYVHPLGNPAAGAVRDLLAGAAAPFRNLYKFDPVLRLPLALGAAHLASVLAAAWPRVRTSTAGVVVLVAAVALGVTAVLPLAANRTTNDEGFDRVPPWWEDVARLLSSDTRHGRALLVPAAPFGQYVWGRTEDDPLQAHARTPWAVRNLIPLGGEGTILLLDAVEDILSRGGSEALAPLLTRSGITHVVVRNDLDWETWGSLRPSHVRRSLLASGLSPAFALGPTLGDLDPSLRHDAVAKTHEADLSAVEVYRVPGDGRLVEALPLSESVGLVGGPGSLAYPEVAEFAEGRPVFLVGDPENSGVVTPRRVVVTDELRLRHVDFGLVRSNRSHTLTEGSAVAGRPPRSLLPFPGAPQATLDLGELRSVEASSEGSWLLQIPESSRFAAVDGYQATAWVTGSAEEADGEWIELVFAKPRDVGHVTVTPLLDGPWRPVIRRVRVVTDTGSVTHRLEGSERPQILEVPEGPTRLVKLVLQEVRGDLPGGPGPGLREVVVPGLRPSQSVRVPRPAPVPLPDGSASATSTSPPIFVFRRTTADPTDILRADEEPVIDRTFDTDTAASWQIEATATPVGGPALERLLPSPAKVRIRASTTFDDRPSLRAALAFDGDTRTMWVPAPPRVPRLRLPAQPGQEPQTARGTGEVGPPVPTTVDPRPTLHLEWGEPRTIDEVRLVAGSPFSRPDLLLLRSDTGEERLVMPGTDGRARFLPLTTTSLQIEFPHVVAAFSDSTLGGRTRLPIGVAEIEIPALEDLLSGAHRPSRRIVLPCGEGPDIEIDGRLFPTRLETTVGEVEAHGEAEVSLCDGARRAAPSIPLGAGRHRVRSTQRAPFVITSIRLTPRTEESRGQPSEGSSRRQVEVVSWDRERRVLRVGSGPASVLAVQEAYNDGWRAEADGRPLRPVRLDGWRQGFVLPAGPDTMVTLEFAPGRLHRASLAVGLLLVVGVASVALRPERSSRSRPGSEGSAGAGLAGEADECEQGALEGDDPPSVRAASPAFARTRKLGALVGPTLVGLWCTGPVAATIPLWSRVFRRSRRRATIITCSALLGAGLVAALEPASPPAERAGPHSLLAQGLAGAALAGVIAGVRVRPHGIRDDGVRSRVRTGGAAGPDERPVYFVPTPPPLRPLPSGEAPVGRPGRAVGTEVPLDRRAAIPFFPALEGLRGVSVAAVVAFHAGLPWATGGFLGVSTFFTLSGFLICSLLVAEARTTGGVDLLSFWARRARRLVPAALATVTLVILVTFLQGPPSALADLRGDVSSAVLHFANWWFLIDGRSYGELFSSPSPLLHFWSLSVEEQAYLLIAPLAALTLRGRRGRGRMALVLAAVVSIPLWAGLRGWDPDRVYYGTDTRLAEVAFGGLLALATTHRGFLRWVLSRSGSRVVAAAGAVAGAVSLAAWMFVERGDSWLYKGGFPLFGMLSAILVCSALLDRGPVWRVLTSRPLRIIGRVSYAVYLIHWPLFVWARARGLDGTALALVGGSVAFALALVSERYLELPFRYGVRPRRLAPGPAWAVCLVLLMVTASLATSLVTEPNDFTTASRNLALASVAHRSDMTQAGALRVAVFGDSTALVLAEGLGRLQQSRRGPVVVVGGSAQPGCPLLVGGLRRLGEVVEQVPEWCSDRDREWVGELRRTSADVALVGFGPWDLVERRPPGFRRFTTIGDPVYDRALLAEMVRLVDLLSAEGVRVLWLTNPPVAADPRDPSQPTRVLGRHPERFESFDRLLRRLVELRPGRVRLVDLAGWLRRHDPGDRMRPDGVHVGDRYAVEVAERFLAPEIARSAETALSPDETSTPRRSGR